MLLFLACQPQSQSSLTIATAASLRYLAEELVADFEHKTSIDCQIVVGSTGKLTAQVMAGAPYDVLLSADEFYPKTLAQAGKTQGEIEVFNRSGLVLWTWDTLSPLSLDHLAENDRIAIANPATAPFGRLADSLLQLRPDYTENIKPRLVFGESIAQVNQFISTAAVKYGLTAALVVADKTLQHKGHWVKFGQHELPQSCVIIAGGEVDNAEVFVKYLQSAYKQ